MNMKNKSIVISVCLLGAAGAWQVARSPASKPAARAATAVTVSAVAASRQQVAIELQSNGTVAPVSIVELRSETSAAVSRVHVREGQFVRAGDVLFTLDARSEHASIDKAQAQLARDQVLLADLVRQFTRSGELAAQKFISQGAVDALQAQVEAQRALLESDRATLRLAQVALGHATISAPLAGRIGAINVFAGSLAQIGTVLASVTQLDPITVSFSVPESSLQTLLESQKAGPVTVTVTLVDQHSTRLKGIVSFIDSSVDPVAGTIRVKASFDNRTTMLWPGQFVDTTLTLGQLDDAVVVPLAAIVTGTKGSFVYSIEADRSAKLRPIAMLHAFGSQAVVSGLSGIERIIVDGKQNLRPGGKVLEVKTPVQTLAVAEEGGAR